MLGGAATHFALAASFFDDVRVIGPVGDDFDDASWEALGTRGTITDDVERVAGGKTFFWRGEYHAGLNTRETLETELNVFETFEPKLSDAAAQCDVLFLANIQPDLQRAVREQCRAARFVAMDSMDLWINIARDSLVETIRGVDCLLLNDEELELLAGQAELRQRGARDPDLGAARRRRQAGRVRRGAVHRGRLLRAARLPARARRRPDRRRRQLRRRLRRFDRRASRRRRSTTRRCVRAMVYGTALASFNVEAFGTERMIDLTSAEIDGRVEELERMTTFRARADRAARLSAGAAAASHRACGARGATRWPEAACASSIGRA